MTPITLTLELAHNNRVARGVFNKEDHWTTDDFEVMPWNNYRDMIRITLANLDMGRFDAEGDNYIVDFLNILPGDLINWEVVL